MFPLALEGDTLCYSEYAGDGGIISELRVPKEQIRSADILDGKGEFAIVCELLTGN